jgi:predicted choloylglycine hydrolase
MYSPYHIYEDVDAFYHPDMSGEERGLLDKIRKKARVISRNFLPEHYRFLDEWAPDSYDGELYDMA